MKTPIVFLSPKKIEGIEGLQVVNDETHEVTEVTINAKIDLTKLKDGYSYKVKDE